MKWIKKFNELKDSTYINASKKLAIMGHDDRAKNIEQHGNDMKKKMLYSNTKKEIDRFSKYGTFKYRIDDFIGEFYLGLEFCDDIFNDSYDENDFRNGNMTSLCLMIDLIPSNEETMDYIYDEFNKHLYNNLCINAVMWITLDYLPNDHANIKSFPNLKSFPSSVKTDRETLYKDVSTNKFYTYDGFNFIEKKCSVYVNSFSIESWGEFDTIKIDMIDRNNAVRFRKLLIELFSNENFDYPNDIYGDVERCVLIQNSFSSEFGFNIESIGDYFKSISVNRFYK
jgi:hypothetical protein